MAAIQESRANVSSGGEYWRGKRKIDGGKVNTLVRFGKEGLTSWHELLDLDRSAKDPSRRENGHSSNPEYAERVLSTFCSVRNR